MKNFIPKGYFAGQKPHLIEVAALHCTQVIPGSWYPPGSSIPGHDVGCCKTSSWKRAVSHPLAVIWGLQNISQRPIFFVDLASQHRETINRHPNERSPLL